MLLSTGEKGLAEAIMEEGGRVRAGQTVRLIDIPADAGANMGLFEDLHGHDNPAAFADALKAAASKHYGHVFRAFITQVQKRRTKVEASLGNGLPDYLEKLCGDDADGQVRRVAKRFHACAVAGELATQWGLLPWQKGEASSAVKACFKAWLRHRGGTGAAEDAEIISQVSLFLEKHGASRFQDLNQPDEKCIHRVGFKRKKNGMVEYIILPESFRQELCYGLDPKRAAAVLERKGLLVRDGGSYMRKVALPGLGRQRCYVIVVKDKEIEDVPE